jgi:hypothetical protein
MTAAGKNGAHPRVETGYIITGATYAVPNVVFALDDPKWFPKATETSLATLTRKVAKAVAQAYPDEYTPSLVVWVHTHPNGGTKPSATDRENSESVRKKFKQELGTDDFEFFNAVHGYDEINASGTISERFVPSNMTSGFEWAGDTHEHRMSLWDADFTTPAPTTVITDE